MMQGTMGKVVAGFVAVSLLSGCADIKKIKNLVEDALGDAAFGFPVDFSDPNATYSAEIKVVDATRAPVQGASIAINGTTFASDDKGLIKLDNLKVNNIQSASVVADGFMRSPVKLSYAKAGQGAAIVQLTPVEVSVVMDSSLGGTVAGQTVRATFQKDSFVRATAPGSSPAYRPLADEPYTGQVTINLASIDVNSQVFDKTEDDGTLVLKSDLTPDRVPSGFFTSVGEDGIERTVLPESVLAVEMYDADGNPLQLAEGKDATIGLQLPTISGMSEGDAMNILSYDEESSVWRDDSACQVQPALGTDGEASGKKECVGQVSHFTLKTVSTNGTLASCVRMQFLMRKSVEDANKDNLRFQRMEILTGAKNADGTYAVQTNDTDYLTDASMCYHGMLTFVRTVVQFKTKTDKKLVEEYKTPWFLASRRGIKSGSVPNEICAECDVIVYNQPTEQGKASGSTPVVQPVDADNDGYIASKDCNDADATINPGAAEDVCASVGKDLNCDGVVPPATIAIPANNATSDKINAWNSTYCAKANAGLTCVAKATSDTGGNGIDEDCDGVISDRDNDGQFGLADSDSNGRVDDCDDANAKVNQNATESDATPADDDCDGTATYNECLGPKNTCGANSTCTDPNQNAVTVTLTCTCNAGYSLVNGVCTFEAVDTIAPNTTLSSGPTGTVADTDATFGFSCSESSCTFECKLDSGSYAACTNPKTYNSLATSTTHTFSVRAIDAANNVDASPATRTWTISGGSGSVAPETYIDTTIPGSLVTTTTGIAFDFSCSTEPCTYMCSVEVSGYPASEYFACNNPHTVSGWSDGETWALRVIASNGTATDPTPAEIVWDVSIYTAPPSSDVTAVVAAGDMESCAIDTGGALYCWGGSYGSSPTKVGTDTFWRGLEAGTGHFCAISSDSSLYCWGDNFNGQLGDGGTSSSSTPTPVSAGTTWQVVAPGATHTCGVRLDGTLWCWGDNGVGQLGLGSSADGDRLVPIQVGVDTNWADVSATYGHTCAIKTTGALYCWGYNGYGELGSGDSTPYTSPHQESTAASNWAKVEVYGSSTYGSYSCATKTTGTLWCWGDDAYDKLGLGVGNNTTNAALQVGSDTDWNSLDLGGGHACATKSGGTLYCWGDDSNDALGNGAGATSSDVPVQVGTDADWADVATGMNHVLGTRGTGVGTTFYGWGDNSVSQVGDGSPPPMFPPYSIDAPSLLTVAP